MKQRQMVYQKFIIFSALVLASISFLYALGFATDLYSLNYHSDPNSSLLYVEGADLYYQIQPFNKILLRDAAIQFVLCIFMFAVLTHRRRLYYVSNYITSVVFAGFAGYLGASILVNALYIRQKYLEIDFERMKEITEMLKLRFVDSTFMLDFGIVLSYVLFALAGGIIANLIWKSVNMRKEKMQEKGA
ncbi:MAG: hypothetical protein AB1Z23_08415 [Eubacteriales bacterium]